MTPSADLLALEKRIVEAGDIEALLRSGNDEFWLLIGNPFLLCPTATPLERDTCRDLFLKALRGSLDAALQLVSRVLPGWSWSVEQFPKLRAQLAQPVQTEFGKAIGVRAQVYDAATPALAVILALVRALAHNPAVEK